MNQIGKFKILRELGSGGFGAVYLGEDPDLGDKVAIKVFRIKDQALARDVTSATGDAGEILKERFLNEAKMLRQLEDSPHVVNVREFGRLEDDTPYFVMPYFPHSLVDLIGRDAFTKGKLTETQEDQHPRAIPIPKALDILEQILEGLATVHQLGLVHRDIKPANILLEQKGQLQNVVLCDFGIAKSPEGEHSKTGVGMGSANYVSPEQRESAKHVDARSDVFSVGVLAYRMLTGTVPNMTGMSTIKALLPSISTELNDLIMSAIHPETDERPLNAKVFLKTLKSIENTISGAINETEETGTQIGGNDQTEVRDELKPLYEKIKAAWLNDGEIDAKENELFVAMAALVDLSQDELKKLIQRVYDEHKKQIKPLQNITALLAERIAEQITKTNRQLEAHTQQVLQTSAQAIGWDDITFNAMLSAKIGEYEKAQGWKPLKQKQNQKNKSPSSDDTKIVKKASSSESKASNKIMMALVVLTVLIGGVWLFGFETTSVPITETITGPITEPEIENNFTITPPKVDESAKQKEQELAKQKAKEQADRLAEENRVLKEAQRQQAILEKQKADKLEADAQAARKAEKDKALKEAQRKQAEEANKPKLYALTVQPEPSNATVKILNINPKYEDGIELEAGDYHISVSAPGYETTNEWLTLTDRALNHRVRLTKKASIEAKISPIVEDEIFGIKLVTIPAGSFMMGSNEQADEQPIHKVSIQSFKMMAHEVTWMNYQPCIDAGVCRSADDKGLGKGKRPVINVSWDDTQSYIKWLNQKTGQTFRLPSEAEWEYAARAGSTSKYSWGDRISCSQARYGHWNGECGNDRKTVPVDSYNANDFGLYNMHGNVWEWTQDCWNETYVNAPTMGEVWSSGDCAKRVLRGGSWHFKPNSLRSASRIGEFTNLRGNDSGFRLVLGKYVVEVGNKIQAEDAEHKQKEPISAEKIAQDYQLAYEMIKEKRFDEGIELFHLFIEHYPESELAGNAYYWLGEVYLAISELQKAKQAFSAVISNYSSHSKVADCLYKLGVTFDRLQDPAMAEKYISQVIEKYPGTIAEKLAKNYRINK